MTNDSWLLVTLQAVYQHMLVAEPHVSRQRVKEMYQERQNTRLKDGRNTKAEEKEAIVGGNLAPSQDRSLMATVSGWNDIVTGKPYAKDYETAPQGIQSNYEMGRAIAVVVRRHQELPPWPRDMTIMQMYERGMICDEAAVDLVAENKWFMRGMNVKN